jgi:hypothetical protein
MKVEFSHECEIAAYLFVLRGFNVRVNDTRELHIRMTESRCATIVRPVPTTPMPPLRCCPGTRLTIFSFIDGRDC